MKFCDELIRKVGPEFGEILDLGNLVVVGNF
jgi:hypothetical protein